MKFGTFKNESGIFIGIVNEDGTHVLSLVSASEKMNGEFAIPAAMIDAIALGEQFIQEAQKIVQWAKEQPLDEDLYLPLETVTLMAPIPKPSKNIFCVGKNYADHAIEMGSKDDIPEHIMVFTKAPTSVIGDGEKILEHKNVTEQLDYEGELAVVIGKEGKAIEREKVLDHVFGYTIVNDVTARDLQAKHKQFFIGKSLDTTCPMGPWIVHKSAIENPNNLNIQTTVNDEVRQDSNTEKFIFPIEEIISVLSQGMTLEPGDIIATGTPAGVGKGFKPPRFLKGGDVIEITVEGIGTLKNTVKG
ncbi:fumarylacetoacetate hydrolase family protein [Mesobacillus subterraneus]|uniref:fumarylacetoacetate hydrolase family protein n=1 Tax=Mesobacillus subterraneus TaxID=285983 RepID=UPI0020404E27|nr:fumarylacetoacetate hydrolase family protein [Mesobacillus subterraneus]MCM3662970.1 fumarylacetoacetate hydrolase family protein [Mesobacillus subterraneus]MCM3682854.1 fumarylacetoacetate hydrolase family protein [Mesobacillus subterraneus]